MKQISCGKYYGDNILYEIEVGETGAVYQATVWLYGGASGLATM